MMHLLLPQTKEQAHEFLRLALRQAEKFGVKPEDAQLTDGRKDLAHKIACMFSAYSRKELQESGLTGEQQDEFFRILVDTIYDRESQTKVSVPNED